MPRRPRLADPSLPLKGMISGGDGRIACPFKMLLRPNTLAQQEKSVIALPLARVSRKTESIFTVIKLPPGSLSLSVQTPMTSLVTYMNIYQSSRRRVLSFVQARKPLTIDMRTSGRCCKPCCKTTCHHSSKKSKLLLPSLTFLVSGGGILIWRGRQRLQRSLLLTGPDLPYHPAYFLPSQFRPLQSLPSRHLQPKEKHQKKHKYPLELLPTRIRHPRKILLIHRDRADRWIEGRRYPRGPEVHPPTPFLRLLRPRHLLQHLTNFRQLPGSLSSRRKRCWSGLDITPTSSVVNDAHLFWNHSQKNVSSHPHGNQI